MFGDGIRYNIAQVDPGERALLRDAIKELHHRYFPGTNADVPPGGVSWWFKQDEIHQATHVHGGPEFLPWHREIVNRFEAMIRTINPQLSLHYWDFNDDPTNIPNGNIGGGLTGLVNLFDANFMGASSGVAGEPWLSAGFYDPHAGDPGHPDRDVTEEPYDPPGTIERAVTGGSFYPITDLSLGSAFGTVCPMMQIHNDGEILSATTYPEFRIRLECVHNFAHGYIGGTISNPHISFRDPFVFLLHSNIDRLFARWQTDPLYPGRLSEATVYGSEANLPVTIPNPDGPGTVTQNLANQVEPWSTGVGFFHSIRPWSEPGSAEPHTYHDISVVTPPCYDTNLVNVHVLAAENVLDVSVTPNRYKVNFNDVPDTETTWRSATIRLYACTPITLSVVGPAAALLPFSVITTMPLVIPHEAEQFVDARIWFQFTAPAPSAPPAPHNITPVNCTIHCDETGQDFLFELTGNTIPLQTCAVELVLDQTGSMSLPAGSSGSTRLEVLKSAAHVFAKYIPAGNGIGITRFDDVAYAPNDATYGGMVITNVASDDFGDGTRVTASGVIDAHGAHGNTSIGAGLQMGQSELGTPAAAPYDNRALIILTDGLENRHPYINEVLVDSRTYALGLGNELQVDTSKLFAIAGGSGGYLLLTGTISDGTDDFFRLRKFFLQICAHVSNIAIVSDPSGFISPGEKIKIPFALSEADINCKVVLLTDFDVVKLSIETPGGKLIDPANAASFGVKFDSGTNMKESRFGLPVAFQADKIQAGTWYAVLEIDDAAYKKAVSAGSSEFANRNNNNKVSSLRAKGAQYCVSIHSFSNLKMSASINQSGFRPGSVMYLKAVLSEYNLPVAHRAKVKVELELPDHTMKVVPMDETDEGVFTVNLTATMSGIYRFRVIAEGASYYGTAFTREQLLNGAVYHEVTSPEPTGTVNTTGGDLPSLFAKCCSRMSIFVGIIILLLLFIVYKLFFG
jgi:hypothetical protein